MSKKDKEYDANLFLAELEAWEAEEFMKAQKLLAEILRQSDGQISATNPRSWSMIKHRSDTDE